VFLADHLKKLRTSIPIYPKNQISDSDLSIIASNPCTKKWGRVLLLRFWRAKTLNQPLYLLSATANSVCGIGLFFNFCHCCSPIISILRTSLQTHRFRSKSFLRMGGSLSRGFVTGSIFTLIVSSCFFLHITELDTAAVIYGVMPLQPVPEIIIVNYHPNSLIRKRFAVTSYEILNLCYTATNECLQRTVDCRPSVKVLSDQI